MVPERTASMVYLLLLLTTAYRLHRLEAGDACGLRRGVGAVRPLHGVQRRLVRG